MLHKRCLPQKEFDDLKLVFDFKIELLDWLLRTPPTNLNDKSGFPAQFDQAKVNWLWLRIRSPAKRTPFGCAIDNLISASKANPNSANLVADAIAADIKLDTDWDVQGFGLDFPRLHEDWLDLVKNVASPFYDWLASDAGFKADTFGLQHGDMTRARLMESYRTGAGRVCGYCDGEAGEKGKKKEANDCDHFFPRSRWPHLAIHPRNLYSACKPCNETWKANSKPMGSGDAAGLRDSYHPMLRPGIDFIKVIASQSTSSPRRVVIKLSDPVISKRAETLNNSLELDTRWTNWINGELDRDVSVFVSKSVQQRSRGKKMSNAELIDVISTEIQWHKKDLGKLPHCLRLVAALDFQEKSHLAEIISELHL